MGPTSKSGKLLNALLLEGKSHENHSEITGNHLEIGWKSMEMARKTVFEHRPSRPDDVVEVLFAHLPHQSAGGCRILTTFE